MLHVYTMEQVYAFEEAGRGNSALDLAETATAFRAAQLKDAAWKKYMDHIAEKSRRSGKKESKKPTVVISREQAAALKKLASRRRTV